MGRNILIITVIFLTVMKTGRGQDIHFSQYLNAPLTYNPANTGMHKGDWRISNNYKRQWGTLAIPFVSLALAYDRQFYLHSENFSGGILVLADKSGDASLSDTRAYFSGAYHKSLRGFCMNAGIQGGYVMKTFNMSDLSFPDQFDMETGEFNSALATSEKINNERITYFDLNTGISLSRKLGKAEPLIGFALGHINRPRESFYNKDFRLSIKNTLHGSVKFTINNVFVVPNFISTNYNGASYVLVGSNGGYRFPENKSSIKSIYTGVLLRTGIDRNIDAAVAIVGLQVNQFNFGLSYDVTVSDLQEVNHYQGGVELSIIYTAPSTNLNRVAITCERD